VVNRILIKLLGEQLSNIRNKKEIPYRLLFVSNVFSIIGAVGSITLGIVSLILAIQSGKQAQKIQNMDSLLNLMARQNIHQDTLISQLKKLDSNTINLVQATTIQTNYTQQKDKPEVGYTYINIDSITNGKEYAYIINVGVKNFGQRIAYALQEDIYIVYIKDGAPLTRIKSFIEKKQDPLNSSLKANAESSFSITFRSTPQAMLLIKNSYFILRFKYIDPLYNQVKSVIYYVVSYTYEQDGSQVYTRLANKEEISVLKTYYLLHQGG
jgi:hypothetical protein